MTQARSRLSDGQAGSVFQVTNAGEFHQELWGCPEFHQQGPGVDYASEATYFEVGGSASFALGMDRTYQPGSTQATRSKAWV